MSSDEKIDFGPKPIGVGSPAILHLHEFGRMIFKVFGVYPVLVGSALKKKDPRDIDVRVGISNLKSSTLFAEYKNVFDAYRPGTPWAVICMAFSALAKQMTGLNVDFQIQFPGLWNKHEGEPRLELGRDPKSVTESVTEKPVDPAKEEGSNDVADHDGR